MTANKSENVEKLKIFENNSKKIKIAFTKKLRAD
jgi:hypothetical protein